jgi:ATP-dependent Clp protease ATP-binding subunit ClpC
LYSQDLTSLARLHKLDPVVGRGEEIERVIQILSRRTKNNAVLVGDSGVGKTAIVEGLANMIANGDVPDPIKGKRILALDLSGLVAGTKYRGEFEKRLKAILDEVISSERQIILFIDELHTLAEAGEASGAIDAADILKPALARGELQAIGATTQDEYEEYIVRDVTLERRFQPVVVVEPNVEQTFAIIAGLRSRYESHHKVKISDDALHAAVNLSQKLLPDRHFPDKAIDAMDEAAAKVRLAMIKAKDTHTVPTVTAADVQSVIDAWARDLLCFSSHPKNPKGRPSASEGVQPPTPEAHSS